MTTFLGPVTSGVVLLTLLAAGVAHLSRPGALPAALRAQRVLPPAAVPVAAAGAVAAEVLLGAAGVGALLLGHRAGLVAVLLACAALCAGYAGYTRYALSTGSAGAPCGCSRTPLPLSGWVAGRALVLAVLATLAALLTATSARAPAPLPEQAVVLLATLTCALLLWHLPAAMWQPTRPGGARRWTS